MRFTITTFYQSGQWITLVNLLRLERVAPDGFLYCAHCGKPIVHKYDCIGHHRIELTEQNVNDFTISLNPELIDLVHHRCHNEIHSRFGHEPPKRVYLVYGPPLAGKTSFVRQAASRQDLVLDLDSIWEMITINERYDKPERLKQCVFSVRDCILDLIRCRTGKWVNAWVIGGYPRLMERERLSRVLGAERIYIDTDQDTCLSRAMERGGGHDKFVLEWFEHFQPDPPTQ